MMDEKFEERMRVVEGLKHEEKLSEGLEELEAQAQKIFPTDRTRQLLNTAAEFDTFYFKRLRALYQRRISRFIYLKGKILFDLNDIKESRECLKRALEMREITLCLSNGAEIDLLDVAYAAFHYASASSFKGEEGPPETQEELWKVLAKAELYTRKAIEVLSTAAEDYDRCFHLGNMYHNLGFLRQIEGNFWEAISFYEEALNLKKEIDDKRDMGLTLARRWECLLEISETDFKQAAEFLQDSPGRIIQLKRIMYGSFNSMGICLREIQDNSKEAQEAKRKSEEFREYLERARELQEKYQEVSRSPVVRAKVVLEFLLEELNGAMDAWTTEKVVDGYRQVWQPQRTYSLLPLRLLESRAEYPKVKEFLQDLQRCLPKDREKKTNRADARIELIRKILKERQVPFSSEEEKRNFAIAWISTLRKIVAASLELEELSEPWREYLPTFLENLKEFVLFGAELSKECNLGDILGGIYSEQAIREAFNIK